MLMSYLEQEIHEQPEVMAQLLAGEQGTVERLAAAIRERDIQYIMVAARGTSDNAARYGQYLFGAMNAMPVALATPSLFSIYGAPPRLGNALVMGISQSGQSPGYRQCPGGSPAPGGVDRSHYQRARFTPGRAGRSLDRAARRD